MLWKKVLHVAHVLRTNKVHYYLLLILLSLIPAEIVAISNINQPNTVTRGRPFDGKLARVNVCGDCPVDGTACSPDTASSPSCVELTSCSQTEPIYNIHVCVDGKYMSYFQAGGTPPTEANCFPSNPCEILGVTVINNNSSSITNNVQSSAQSGSSSNNATTNVSVSNTGNVNTVNINSNSSNVSQSNSSSSNKVTLTPTPRPTATPTPRPTNTPTPKPTAKPTPTPTKFLTPTPTRQPEPTPTPTPTPQPSFNIFSWFTPPTPTPTAAIIYVYPPTPVPTTYTSTTYTPTSSPLAKPTPTSAYAPKAYATPTVTSTSPVYPSNVEKSTPVYYPSTDTYQPPVQILPTYAPTVSSPLILTSRDNDIITQTPPTPYAPQTIKTPRSPQATPQPRIEKLNYEFLNIANYSMITDILSVQARADYGSSVDLQLQPLTGTADSLLLGRKNLGFETNVAEFNWDSTSTPNGVYNLFAVVSIVGQPKVIVGPVQIKIENVSSLTSSLTANDITSPSTFLAANVPVDKDTVIDKVENTNSQENNGIAITLSGKSRPNTIIAILIYSNPIVATVKTDENGVWSYTLEKPLPAGKHETYVVLKDSEAEVRSEVKEFFIAPVYAGGVQNESLVLESTNDYQQIINFLVVSGFVLLSAVGCFILVLIFIKTFKFISINI